MYTFNLTLPYTPNLGASGGNARHAHWAQRYTASMTEKDAWTGAIRANMIPPFPRFQHAKVIVIIYFKEYRRRDIQDNVAMSLKPLWDALVFWNCLIDDSADFLTVVDIQVRVDAENPRTELIMTGELMEM